MNKFTKLLVTTAVAVTVAATTIAASAYEITTANMRSATLKTGAFTAGGYVMDSAAAQEQYPELTKSFLSTNRLVFITGSDYKSHTTKIVALLDKNITNDADAKMYADRVTIVDSQGRTVITKLEKYYGRYILRSFGTSLNDMQYYMDVTVTKNKGYSPTIYDRNYTIETVYTIDGYWPNLNVTPKTTGTTVQSVGMGGSLANDTAKTVITVKRQVPHEYAKFAAKPTQYKLNTKIELSVGDYVSKAYYDVSSPLVTMECIGDENVAWIRLSDKVKRTSLSGKAQMDMFEDGQFDVWSPSSSGKGYIGIGEAYAVAGNNNSVYTTPVYRTVQKYVKENRAYIESLPKSYTMITFGPGVTPASCGIVTDIVDNEGYAYIYRNRNTGKITSVRAYSFTLKKWVDVAI